MKKPAIFLCLTFLLSWPVAFLSFGSGMNLYTAGGLVMAVYFMLTPSTLAECHAFNPSPDFCNKTSCRWLCLHR